MKYLLEALICAAMGLLVGAAVFIAWNAQDERRERAEAERYWRSER
jgi:biopolymer transport protein ExbB/TolQ